MERALLCGAGLRGRGPQRAAVQGADGRPAGHHGAFLISYVPDERKFEKVPDPLEVSDASLRIASIHGSPPGHHSATVDFQGFVPSGSLKYIRHACAMRLVVAAEGSPSGIVVAIIVWELPGNKKRSHEP